MTSDEPRVVEMGWQVISVDNGPLVRGVTFAHQARYSLRALPYGFLQVSRMLFNTISMKHQIEVEVAVAVGGDSG